MDLDELKKNWDGLAKEDPLWAILSDPAKKGGQWDEADFFDTGKINIKGLIQRVRALKIDGPTRRALDFGCGVGRLTQALCGYYEESHGVDISATMVQMAMQKNQHGTRCRYHLNEANDLKLFESNSFDLILSLLVLQHMEPRYSSVYIQEFLRILSPAGVLIFQLPSEWSPAYKKEHPIKSSGREYRLGRWMSRVKKYFANRVSSPEKFVPRMEMYGIPKDDVSDLIRNCGGRVIEALQDQGAGKEWISFTYFITK